MSPLIKTSWERFKFGGRPQAQQQAFFVSLKELPNNRFGTPSEIYWDDAYLNAQVGALARGTYTLRIIDPILFVRNWVPAKYSSRGGLRFHRRRQRCREAAVPRSGREPCRRRSRLYTNDPSQGNRMTRIQQDTVGFAQSLSEAVEHGYQWRSGRGLEIVNTAIIGIEYDDATRELLKTVQRADALLGARGNSNMQASVAAGIQAAGEDGRGERNPGRGMATGTAGAAGLQQPVPEAPTASASGSSPDRGTRS